MGLGFESQRNHKKPRFCEAFSFYIYLMPFVYILYSTKLNKHYVGACIDLQRRLYEHNIGHSKFTSTGVPWVIRYTEEHNTLPEAKKRELEIKKKKSRKYIEELIAKR